VIPVIWHEAPDTHDGRAHYAITTLLNDEIFDNSGLKLKHCRGMRECPPYSEEAIFIIHGEHEHNRFTEIRDNLSSFRRALIILGNDDSGNFPAQNLLGQGRKLWYQFGVPGRHDQASRFLTCSYPSDAKTLLAPYNSKSIYRPLDWMFSGQITHRRREECAAQLRDMPCGFLHETKSFWYGLERPEYYRLMASAKIIPCPSGPVTPDTIRMAEALEAGCLPIIDATCSRAGYPDGYWEYVLGETPPLPIIRDWSTLPQVMEQELSRWPYNRDIAVEWWKQYKESLRHWLAEDLQALRENR
jgi:hypothetical protein